MWLQIRLQKLLLDSCGKDTSWSLEHWPSSWVTKESTLRTTLSASCVSSWAFRRWELHLTIPRLMDKWSEPSKLMLLMWMIRKLSKDQKADWPKHLPELVHAYNSTRLVITAYSLHYLIFEQWPCLPIDFYFPTIVSPIKYQCVDCYVTDLC